MTINSSPNSTIGLEVTAKCSFLAAALLLSMAYTTWAQSPCSLDFPHDSNPTRVTDHDICNFHQVDEGLYRGGRPKPSAYRKLVQLGVRTVIDLEETEYAEPEKAVIDELNAELPAEQRIDFISFPVTPREIEGSGISHDRLGALFGQIRDARRPIFVHCYHGKDRTGAVVAIYRMRMNEKSFEEAYQEALHYFFSRNDHGLGKTVNRYESPKNLQTLPRPQVSK